MSEIDQAVVEQVNAARAGVALWRDDNLALVRVHGPDAAAYLHNMLTANVKALAVGQGAYTLKTSARGMPEAAGWLYRIAELEFWLMVEGDQAKRTVEILEKLHITESLTIEDASGSWATIAIQGKDAAQLLATRANNDVSSLQTMKPHQVVQSTLAGQSVTIARESLTGDSGFLVCTRSNDAPTIFEALRDAGKKFGMVEPSEKAREVLRIEAGLPRFGRDILPNAVASELGINHEAFHYDKGCYIGQEILARIHTKAEVPFRLMGVCFAENAPVPESGTPLDAPDSKGAAILTSAAYSPTLGRPIAIARVKRGYQTQGVKLANDAEVVELPLYVPAPSDKRSDLYDRAITLFAQDRGAEALALLEQELAANPANMDALEALGVIHDRAGRHKEAIVAMKRIVERDPKHLMANVNLSLYHMKLGDKATAEDYQAKATRISMERRMAEARAQGKTPTAEDDAQRAAKLEARLDKFKAIIEMDPKDVLGHFGAGKACIDLKRFREAAGHFEKVVELQRDYSVAWANLGAAYAALGETDKARKVFEEGIAVASTKGDLMPKRDMEHRLSRLKSAESEVRSPES